MIDMDLVLQQCKLLCDTEGFHETIQRFIKEENLFCGSSNTEIAENYLKKIAVWKEQYQCQSEVITLNGVLCWYFDATFYKITATEQDFAQLPFFLLKLWLVNWHKDLERKGIPFDRTKDWNFIKRAEIYEGEFTQCCRLSADEFLKDLEEFYDISLNRFEYYKTESGRNPKVVEELTPQYPRYFAYISYFREHFGDANVIRINRLGSGDDEFALYIVKGAEGTYLVVVSDFA